MGDHQGSIRFLSPDFVDLKNRSFQAHNDKVAFCALSAEGNVLVTIGLEPKEATYQIRSWNLTKKYKEGPGESHPEFSFQDLKGQDEKKILVPTCLAVSSDGTFIGVGLADGCVFLVSPYAKPKSHMVEAGIPITGLAFLNKGKESDRDVNCVLYVTTAESIRQLKFERAPRGNDLKIIDIDMKETDQEEEITTKKKAKKAVSSGAKAMTLSSDTNQCIIAQEDGIWLYSPEKRLEDPIPLNLNEMKGKMDIKLLHSFADYLVVEESPDDLSFNRYITIYHVTEKFQALAKKQIEGPILFIASAGGKVFIFTKKTVHTLSEFSEEEQVALYKKRSLHQIAINIAERKKKPREQIAEIYKDYGDSLFNKSDFDKAMEKYLYTIGTNVVEPSAIIEKYLKDRHTNSLMIYLEELHNAKVHTTNHTTLLLNCYSKSKDYKKIKEFIAHADLRGLDVDAAVRVCRMDKKYDDALILVKNQNHKTYLKILLEDKGEYKEALDYIHTLEFEDAAACFKIFGKDLLQELPDETIKLAQELCTNYRKSGTDEPQQSSEVRRIKTQTPQVEESTYIEKLTVHVDSGRQLMCKDLKSSDPFLQLILNKQFCELPPKKETLVPVFNTDVTFSLSGVDKAKDQIKIVCYDWNEYLPPEFMGQITIPIQQCLTASTPKWYPLLPSEQHSGTIPTGEFQLSFTYKPLQTSSAQKAHAEDFIGIFSAKPAELRKFLEFIDESKIERKKNKNGTYMTTIYDTLLELYLQDGREDDAKKLLNRINNGESETPILDPNHAVLVCESQGFTDGTLILYKYLGLPNIVAEKCVEESKYDDLIAICTKNPSSRLWIRALTHLVSDIPAGPEAEKRHQAYLKEVIQAIQRDKLLSPAEVIDIFLKSNQHHQIEVLMPYLVGELDQLQKKLHGAYQNVTRVVKEGAASRSTLDSYKKEAQKFNGGSEPPSYFFLGTPNGYADDSEMMESKRKLTTETEDRVKDLKTIDVSTFNSEIENTLKNSSWEGFSTISNYLQRKIFDKPEKGQRVFDPLIFADLGLVPLLTDK
uniref:C2 domain-containing protein n=1 Tax=Arcella intermedia TaxID=1963864 RepID=A0A6B2KWP0_9EUKA